jgi:hypothetical protein
MSLPHRLGPGPIPPPVRLGVPLGAGGGVGIVAAGSATHPNDRNRSLDPASAARLRALGRDLAPEATGAKDFRETAGIVAGLDLVITVDTSVAHLAACLGKPTWILLPHLGLDWRWGREARAWHPSARFYRQPAQAGWGVVLDRVERDLADFRAAPAIS